MKLNSFIVEAYGPAKLFDLEDEIVNELRQSSLNEGYAFIFSVGSTGALVNLKPKDNDAFAEFTASAIRKDPEHHHPANSFAHLRSTFLGCEKIISVSEGELVGDYRPYLLENTEGPKNRRIDVLLNGEFSGGGFTNMNVSNAKLPVRANGWIDIIDITDFLKDYVREFGVNEGMLNISCMEKNGAVMTTEYEPALLMDTADFLSGLVKDVNQDNRATVLSSVVGEVKSVPIHQGELDLGTWQQVTFVDFGKPGEKELFVQAVGM